MSLSAFGTALRIALSVLLVHGLCLLSGWSGLECTSWQWWRTFLGRGGISSSSSECSIFWLRRQVCQRLSSSQQNLYQLLVSFPVNSKGKCSRRLFPQRTASSASLPFLRAAMSMLYLASLLAISFVRLWGLTVVSLSGSLRMLHATWSGGMIHEGDQCGPQENCSACTNAQVAAEV